MARRVNGVAPTTDGQPSVQSPGAYEYALSAVVHEAIEEPYAALRDQPPEFYAIQATVVAAEIDLRRGSTVVAHNRHLQDGVYRLFGNPGNRTWDVTPDDVVTLRD